MAWPGGGWDWLRLGAVEKRTYCPPTPHRSGGVPPAIFPHFSLVVLLVVYFRKRRCVMLSVENILHDFILQLLRRGFTSLQIAEALASQKVKIMQADEYVVAMEEFKKSP